MASNPISCEALTSVNLDELCEVADAFDVPIESILKGAGK